MNTTTTTAAQLPVRDLILLELERMGYYVGYHQVYHDYYRQRNDRAQARHHRQHLTYWQAQLHALEHVASAASDTASVAFETVSLGMMHGRDAARYNIGLSEEKERKEAAA